MPILFCLLLQSINLRLKNEAITLKNEKGAAQEANTRCVHRRPTQGQANTDACTAKANHQGACCILSHACNTVLWASACVRRHLEITQLVRQLVS